jgi:hypothetical protein
VDGGNRMVICELKSWGSGLLSLVGCCEQVNEPSIFTQCWKFLDMSSNYKIVKRDYVPFS